MKIKLVILLSIISFILSEDGIALITKSKGKVEYKKNDGTIKNRLKPGTCLFNNDRIATGANGFAKYVYLDDGSMIKVHKNAEVYVYGSVDKRSIIKQINVSGGNVKFEVSKQGNNDFTIITPTSVATVKGTDNLTVGKTPVIGFIVPSSNSFHPVTKIPSTGKVLKNMENHQNQAISKEFS